MSDERIERENAYRKDAQDAYAERDTLRAENARLTATLDRVRALAAEWETYDYDYGGEGSLTRQHAKDLRKAMSR